MPTPSEIRNECLKEFYKIYMQNPTAVMPYGLDTFEDDARREIEWLIDRGWLDHLPHSLRLSVAGRDEYERQQVEGGGPCPTCGRK